MGISGTRGVGVRGTEVSAKRPRDETGEVSDGVLGEETRVLIGWEVVIG